MQHLQSIQEMFNDKLFHIPDYQRGYAWERAQWQDLLEDIELMEEGQEHYTGTLVIHARESDEILDDDGKSLKVYDVVDGQQRLTTFSILMNVIAKEFEQIPDKQARARGIRKQYICTTVDECMVPKLTLNRDTHQYYLDHIISSQPGVGGTKIMSEQRLQDAQDFFAAYFAGKRAELGDSYTDWLEQTYAKINARMKLTVYVVPQESEVGVIFEVMNNRGKKLTEMEKVKNYLLYLSSKLTCGGASDLAREINRVWTTIFESLMESRGSSPEHEHQLLRASWLMFADYNAKNWKGSNSVKEKFNLKTYKGRHTELRDDLREYIKLLENACIAYCDVIAPWRSAAFARIRDREELRRQIARETEKLLMIGVVSSFLPVLMAVRSTNPDDYELYLDFLKVCERFAFRVYRFSGKRANTGQSTLFRYGYELFHNETDAVECGNGIKSLTAYYSPNREFEKELELGSRNWYGWTGLKYLLYEYEQHLAGKKPVQISWIELINRDKKDTIEHILPQTPEKDYWRTKWNKEERKLATHDIGNLILTFDNSVYSNKGFHEKKGDLTTKNGYANSVIFMEKEIAKYQEWTFAEFTRRRNEVVEWIKQRWHIEEQTEAIVPVGEEDPEVEEIAMMQE